ncbi:DNA polymerase III subunit alpha [Celerinatantimonas sp. MCCC 1A17872]|uniref:DNA polymerase III subunit alpha n=1 Tax=Celerinatantimonas sp. MCCC 1A17872 TaxID=3177514 RepID=UPI0038C8664F
MSVEPRFIHLRIHSDYSMVDGLKKVKPIVGAVAELQMPAMALTDQTNFCGVVKFYGEAHNKGIKPVIGADFWMHSEPLGDELSRLVILAKDNTGYQNITQLISKAYLRGHVQGRPVIERDWLVEHQEGIIILSGGREGDIGRALLKGNRAMVEEIADFYRQYFNDHYYLELIRTHRPDEETYLHMAVELATEYQFPVVATNEVMFLKEDEFEAHEIRVAIHDGYTLADRNRPKHYSREQFLRSEEQMCELFADIPEALENTVAIAKRCNVTIRLGTYFLPEFPTGGQEIDSYFTEKAWKGLEERLKFLFPDEQVRAQKRDKYDARLQRELDVILQMGFPGYFLIVMEFIQWSKDHKIPVGPGRGSGAGSLVAFSLKITDLDPLAFDLLFERFLNPERVSMPDFDVDFCMDRRDEVIEHVGDLYGHDAVSQIITFGTMAAKAVVRDVGRVLGHPYGFVDRISKLIPPDPGMTLAKAFDAEPRLGEIYDQDEEVRELIDMARILEGVVRNAGKHAGGVVISPTTITDFAPLYCDEEGHHPVTQFDKSDVEYAGLVKFDFLGLRTLTIIQWAVDMANEKLLKRGRDPIDISSIPLDDPKSFEVLKAYKTTAVFQLESRGMKDLIKRLQPDCFEDMIALVALFRPGPLQSGMVDNFIERKHGREEVSYPDATWQHESLKPILDPTYGIILYQEQVMQIAQVLAGYTLGGADLLRRAMGKKKAEEMAKQRAVFEKGAIDNGVDGELSMKIFDLVEKFAGYGFNKSHSAAYALVSYQTLWMKVHYPAFFMAAVMSADMDNTDKIVTLVDECSNLGLTIIPPDVNSGVYRFSVNDENQIVYGIGAIKGVGEGPIETIIQARADGPFRDLFDFCCRVDLKKINKRVMEKLILAGAMDKLGPHRATLMATLEVAIKAASQQASAQAFGQSDLFGELMLEADVSRPQFVEVARWSDKIWLEGEKETLGLYLTGHPINHYLPELKKFVSGRLAELRPTNRDVTTTAAGLVISTRVMITKRGSKMGILQLDDRSGRLDVMLFSEAFEQYQDLIEKDRILVVQGQVSFDDFSGGLKMTAREVMDISQARERWANRLDLVLQKQQTNESFWQNFIERVEPYRNGTCPVTIHYIGEHEQGTYQLGTDWRVTPTDDLIEGLSSLLGHQQVSLAYN